MKTWSCIRLALEGSYRSISASIWTRGGKKELGRNDPSNADQFRLVGGSINGAGARDKRGSINGMKRYSERQNCQR